MTKELEENFDYYAGVEREEKEDIDATVTLRADWELTLERCKQEDAYLSLLHVFVLANVLKRPILVYGSDDDMESYGCHVNGVAGLFVPTRHPPSECYKRPIVICWVQRGHFVPVVHVEGEDAVFP